MNRAVLIVGAALLTAQFSGLTIAHAQGTPKSSEPDITVNASVRAEVIETLLKKLDESYVFPETAKKMGAALRKRLADKEYDKIESGQTFAHTLTEHLQAVSHDKHLRVWCSAETLPVRKQAAEPSPEEIKEQEAFMRRLNYGFEKLERLPGNIGYIDLRMFADPQGAGEKAAAAMNYLADTDALILDLRQNGGGDPAMVAVVCSYFFSGEPVHLNDLYFRPANTTQQFWTLPYVPGRRYLDKPLYVLTSKRTFSGAEECTYNLKNLKRATIVGETTGGGAHPGGVERLNDHFSAFIPVGRAINPITKDNWEGKGVSPDVAVPAEKALFTARRLAIEKMLSTASDPRAKTRLKEVLEELQQEEAGEKKTTL